MDLCSNLFAANLQVLLNNDQHHIKKIKQIECTMWKFFNALKRWQDSWCSKTLKSKYSVALRG